MNIGEESVFFFLLNFQHLPLILLFSKGGIPGTFRDCSTKKKQQASPGWHFRRLELDKQDKSNFRPSLYVIKKKRNGKYELELTLEKLYISFQGPECPLRDFIAIFCSPVMGITGLLQWKKAPVSESRAVHACPTHLVVCVLEEIFKMICISKGDVQLLYRPPHSWSLWGSNELAACSSLLQVTEKVQVPFFCLPWLLSSHPDLQ